jgi:hypothetical protein
MARRPVSDEIVDEKGKRAELGFNGSPVGWRFLGSAR